MWDKITYPFLYLNVPTDAFNQVALGVKRHKFHVILIVQTVSTEKCFVQNNTILAQLG